ncbi:MAG: hypothetical protein KIT22_02185 [Verrucomicrobiae bacterium]|nr:hypothetical protein [Verrucomicrobiae bacterium]
MGPDTSPAWARGSVRATSWEAHLDPNKEISDQYAAILVTKNDGDIVIGRVANLNNDELMIATDMTDPNAFANVKRKDVKSIEALRISPMPGACSTPFQEGRDHSTS